MDSVIDKLTEIEQTASAIVAHAEEEKAEIDREYDERRKKFDQKLEEETMVRIERIREGLRAIEAPADRTGGVQQGTDRIPSGGVY